MQIINLRELTIFWTEVVGFNDGSAQQMACSRKKGLTKAESWKPQGKSINTNGRLQGKDRTPDFCQCIHIFDPLLL